MRFSTTIHATGYRTLDCVSNVCLSRGAVVTLKGAAGTSLIIRVTGGFDLTGGSKILIDPSSGLLPKDVLYDVVGPGGQVALNGGGGGTQCCKAQIDGTVLAPERNIALSPGLVNGAVISSKSISIVSGASVRCLP